MISELNRADFYRCRDLLNEQGQIEARAVVEGLNPGRVFVDDSESPTTGLIWLGNNDGFIFIGNERNEGFNTEIDYFIHTVIKSEAKKVGLTWFEGIGNHPNWDETIIKVFKNRNLGNWKQRVYTLQKNDFQYNFELTLEKGYEITEINEVLFNNDDKLISNIDFLHSKIEEFWDSPKRFFNEGIGYCAVYKNKIVSVCFSGFVVDDVHCIDIETLEEHQGKKLAQKVALTYVKDCLENNLIPYWDCMDSNKPSIAVAENIGFNNVFDYMGYEFKFE